MQTERILKMYGVDKLDAVLEEIRERRRRCDENTIKALLCQNVEAWMIAEVENEKLITLANLIHAEYERRGLHVED